MPGTADALGPGTPDAKMSVARHEDGADVVVELDAERIVRWTIVSAQEGGETVSTITVRRFRHVLVVKEGRLTGIGDVVKSRMGELEFERDHLDSYVHSGQS
jgi:hypothetical protein